MMMIHDGRGLVTGSEAAAMLGLTAESVYRLRRRGVLPATVVDGMWRFSLDDVEAYRQRIQERPGRKPGPKPKGHR